MVYRVMGKLFWDQEIKECEIEIIHRGAPSDRKIISGEKVLEVSKGYFVYNSGFGETVIPYHRVTEVRRNGEVIWKKAC